MWYNHWEQVSKGTLHTFRHFFISMCASSGAVPIATCMTWVGHKDTDMVWHYYHLSDTASQDAMVRMAAHKYSEFGTILAQLPVERQNQVVETQTMWLLSKELQKLDYNIGGEGGIRTPDAR